MKKILLPTDFSNPAIFAHEYAKALAKTFSVDIFAVHAFQVPYFDSSIPAEVRDDIRAQEVKDAEKSFREFFKSSPNQKSNEDVTVRVHERYTISEGTPLQVILRECKNSGSDIIVMGTKGSHNIKEKLIGSVASSVMQKANVPVLVVPEGAVFKGIKNIAYATNFEKGDDEFIEFLEAFSKKTEATCHFVHIDSSDKGKLSKSGKTPETIVHFDMDFVSFTELAGTSIIGSLDNFIETENIDLLAMFIPSRTIWNELFHKSLTKQMVFHTKIPIVFFHA